MFTSHLALSREALTFLFSLSILMAFISSCTHHITSHNTDKTLISTHFIHQTPMHYLSTHICCRPSAIKEAAPPPTSHPTATMPNTSLHIPLNLTSFFLRMSWAFALFFSPSFSFLPLAAPTHPSNHITNQCTPINKTMLRNLTDSLHSTFISAMRMSLSSSFRSLLKTQ
jgi:hypothetical protein